LAQEQLFSGTAEALVFNDLLKCAKAVEVHAALHQTPGYKRSSPGHKQLGLAPLRRKAQVTVAKPGHRRAT
jgi:altronate dehydratase